MRKPLEGVERPSAAWRRIEAEKPSGYWEANIVAGRQRVRHRILQRLSPLEDVRVADLGCGRGAIGKALERQGASVVGFDVRIHGGRGGARVAADLRSPAVRPGVFDVTLVSEVLEECDDFERRQILQTLGEWAAPRLLLVGRCATGWSRIHDRVEGSERLPVVDPTELLRSVHLCTPYRLVGREEVRQRNYCALLAEFRHVHDEREV